MLLALVGVTGVGKSYFVDRICDRLHFKKVNTIRTRAPRKGENPKYFMTEQELNKMNQEGKIAYQFRVFDGEYGYLKDEIFSKDNYIFEMHYTTIYDWKKVRPDIKTIYILPANLEMAKQKTIERNLPKEKEQERLQEIEEHYHNITTNNDLRNQFDYIVQNAYNEESEQKILKLVEDLLNEEQ